MHNFNGLLKKTAFISLIIFFFGACSSLPKTYLEQRQLRPDERSLFNREVFDYAWTKVNTHYFDPDFNGKDWKMLGEKYLNDAVNASDTDQLYKVINKLLSEMEVSHLVAVRNARKDITSRRTKKGAIGVMVGYHEDKVIISSVSPDSPASSAGVQKGWLLVGRDGRRADFSNGKRDDLYTIAGETVTFDFLDQHDNLHSLKMIPVRQDKIRYAEAYELSDGFLYLRLDKFDRKSVKLLGKMLEEHDSTHGVVMDLRYNPGGSLFYSQVAVGHFFSNMVELGTLVTRKGKEREEKSVDFFTQDFDKPVVILTSKQSGSGAELFSHVLQFHGRATVTGQRSAGALLVSRVFRLPDGGEISIPITDYIGLDGKRLEGVGVVPDIEVPVASFDDLRTGKDQEIEKGVEILRNKTALSQAEI